ncbi:Gfo/Idh/MocA family oxidoreductase [Paenibacillus sp. J5C_2022]|uniref:Gfo/Idh/MocA family protein n=1 Tax=Paenibacillus sp. J5C2022 TaxID=2977129 RepID=UPI0021D0D01A|nr:Gfo/Idh/MocA family oxidoreductase [Paenibacillus sp. J5C2022]MCU6707531.1 Gfo/Idh/MocA family oxidoreductase [Paenibacillus sp. J5C2022]
MNEPWKVLIAGCGGMAHAWVEYVSGRADTEIVALVDIREEAARAMAEKHSLSCPFYTNAEHAIEAVQPHIVCDVTIPSSHYGVASAAFRHGSHVFAEKPLAETMEQCQQLVAMAEHAGVQHAIMQNRRFNPHIRSLRQLISSGTIGKVGFIGADFFLGPRFGGFRDVMDSPLLLDMAIHTFDQARLISGANPVSVYCHEFNPAGSWYAGHAMAVCIFEMSDGSVFNYRGSWCAEGENTSWESSWRITGEKGTAIWDGYGVPYAEARQPAEADGSLGEMTRIEGEVSQLELAGHHGCLEEMFNALRDGRKPETHSGDNLYSMAMVFASLESARTGRKVIIEDWLESKKASPSV